MKHKISQRLADIVNALPLKDGIRVLEIGCGTGVAAHEIVSKISNGYVLAIDRSPKAISQAIKSNQEEIESGKLKFIVSSIEQFELPNNEELFDIVLAVRVGILDGRHTENREQALYNIRKALKQGGKLFIDGENPLKELYLFP